MSTLIKLLSSCLLTISMSEGKINSLYIFSLTILCTVDIKTNIYIYKYLITYDH